VRKSRTRRRSPGYQAICSNTRRRSCISMDDIR